MATSSNRKLQAIQRILRDWKEIQQEPFDLIGVHIDQQDIFQWHITLSPPAARSLGVHPFSDTRFHMIMKFPSDYPLEPPSIQPSTFIPHPNVFGSYICLDMLQKQTTDYYRKNADSNPERYTGGWSCAYTAYSILMQLQSFLFNESVPVSMHGVTKHYQNKLDRTDILRAKNAANSYSCATCFFNYPKPRNFTPAVTRWAPYNGGSKVVDLPHEVLCLIFDQVPSHKDIYALRRVCKLFAEVIAKKHVITRKELLCFYSRKMFTDAILGVGIYVERHADGFGIKNINSPFDLLSKEAFEDGLRESVWGQPFEFWMPLLLSGQHGKLAYPLIQDSIVAIIGGPARQMPSFHPLMVLELFPKLMNNLIVNLVKADTKSNALLMSEKSLKGYCSFHHILLHFAAQFPEIEREADYWLGEFISHSSRRVKMVIPDLGELLILLCLSSKYTWDSISKEYLEECFDRNVMWILDKRSGNRPELAYLECYPVSEYRMQETFQATIVSRRLLMFQVAFLKLVGQPKGKSSKEVLEDYRSSYGMPSQEVIDQLHSISKDIFKVNEWGQFYTMLGLEPPSAQQITSALREAVIRSEAKRYHFNRTHPEVLLVWRKEVDAEFCIKGTTHLPLPENPVPYHCYKLPLSNLPYRIQTKDLREIGCQFGSIVSVEIQRGGYGAILYDERESAETAFKYLHGYEIFGHQLRTKEPYRIRTP